MLETQLKTVLMTFTVCFAGAVHIHDLVQDHDRDPDLAQSTSLHLAAQDPAPDQHLRKGGLLQINHPNGQNPAPDQRARIWTTF